MPAAAPSQPSAGAQDETAAAAQAATAALGGNGGDGGGDGARVRAHAARWRADLLARGGRERLLNIRHAAAGDGLAEVLPLRAPGATELLAGLARGWSFAPLAEKPAEPTAGTAGPAAERALLELDTALPGGQAKLDAALAALHRRCTELADGHGLWTLWVGAGALTWRQEGDAEGDAQGADAEAPLVLVPVELRRDPAADGGFRLHRAEGRAAVHNAALAAEFAGSAGSAGSAGLGPDGWDAVTAADPARPEQVAAAASAAVAGRPGWRVDGERTVLGLFATHQQAAADDLAAVLADADADVDAGRLAAHPLVRVLALGADGLATADAASGLVAEGTEPGSVGVGAAGQRLLLDADAQQRRSVADAVAGRSFVVSGPPGTGKSQTAANMIGALVAAGRSVLFVSHRTAALDAVHHRLRDAGLGDALLPLYGARTAPRAVAAELGRVLARTAAAGTEPTDAQQSDRAAELGRALDDYADAVNEPRGPLDRSLFEVLNRLAELDRAVAAARDTAARDGEPVPSAAGAPRAAVESAAAGDLSAAGLERALEAARTAASAWRPAVAAGEFVWRDVVGSAEAEDPQGVVAEAVAALAALVASAERRPFAASAAAPRTAAEVEALVKTVREGLEPGATFADGAGDADGTESVPSEAELTAALAALGDAFGVAAPEDAERVGWLLELAALSGAAHQPPAAWLTARVRVDVRDALDELDAAAQAEAAAAAQAADAFGPQVLTSAELAELAQRFAAQHHGVLARFSGAYRADKSALAALAVDGQWHKGLPARLPDALAWRQAAAVRGELAERHAELLDSYALSAEAENVGAVAAGGSPEAREALAVAERAAWLAVCTGGDAEAFTRLRGGSDASAADGGAEGDAPAGELPGTGAGSEVRAQARLVYRALAAWCAEADRAADSWSVAQRAVVDLFAPARQARLTGELTGPLDDAAAFLEQLRADAEGPDEWRRHAAAVGGLRAAGADALLTDHVAAGLPPEDFPAAVEAALLRAWVAAQTAADERLVVWRGDELDDRAAEFRAAEAERREGARQAVRAACESRRAQDVSGDAAALNQRAAADDAEESGAAGRSALSVRELLHEAAGAVARLKPCVLAAPLTVAELLPASGQFDVVIVDEAGQLPLADAIGAVARGRQLVVLGDERQLAPAEELVGSGAAGSGSLLAACAAAGLPVVPLHRHYRSRHEALIGFSSSAWYGSSLTALPGAERDGERAGVALFEVAGVDDEGRNRIEAAFVAQRVLHHLDADADAADAGASGRSVGVVTLSRGQAETVAEEIARAALLRPDLAARLADVRVCTPDAAQGVEWDTVVLSIGHGPDADGELAADFGALDGPQGEHALNVAVTRARWRLETVVSFAPERLEGRDEPGVRRLREYLEYAARGGRQPEGATASEAAGVDVVEAVRDTLVSWGHQPESAVGGVGYRIDLALRTPSGAALAIECDGPAYDAADDATERDQLRPEQLARLGWSLHRVWSVEWHADRAAAEARLREAVAAAQAPAVAANGEAAAEADELPKDGGPDVVGAPVIPAPAAAERDPEPLRPTTDDGDAAPVLIPAPAAVPVAEESPELVPAGAQLSSKQAATTDTLPAAEPEEAHAAVPAARAEADVLAAEPDVIAAEPELEAESEPELKAEPEPELEPEPEASDVAEPVRSWAEDYTPAQLTVVPAGELHSAGARPLLREALTEAAALEGPVHEELLLTRVRELWGVTRAGVRVKQSIAQALDELVEQGALRREEGGFYHAPEGRPLRGRTPGADAAVGRKVQQVAPVERQLVLAELVAEQPGVRAPELLRSAREFFGWPRMNAEIRTALEADLEALVAQGRVTKQRSGLHPAG